jgi:aspartate racemase
VNYFGRNHIIKTVGIIGGLGPETTSEFYLNLIKDCRIYCNRYPSVVIDSLSLSFSLEKDIVRYSKNEEKLLPLLKESVKRLNRAKVDFIVIPCNTVHVFIEELRRCSSVPIISIVDETSNLVKKRGYKKVGLLATTKTVDTKLYENSSKTYGINILLPTKREQDKISSIIIKILKCNISDKDKKILESIINSLVQRGAEAIILGCTDLQLILTQNQFKIELLDSMKILVQSTFNILFHKNKL